MTIKYLDSKRIVGLSTDIAQTTTYETETFTPNWDPNTTGTQNIVVANSTVEYDVTDSGTSQSTLVYDLGTANISETSWTLRGKSVINNYSSTSGSSCHFFCGLSNGSKTVAFDGSQNSISFAIGVGTSDTAYYLGSSVNGAMYAMTSQTSGNITHLPTAETVWFEIKRNNATSATITLYTDSTYTTSPAGYSRTLTLSSAPTGLRYLVFKSRDRSIASQSLDGYVDDLEFYNGTTSSKPTNVQDNSILVEKDTGNRYWFAGAPTAPTTTSNFPSGNNTSGSVNTRVDIPLTGISVSNGSVSFWVYRPSSGASADNQYVAFSVSNDTQASTEFFVGVYGNSNTVKLMSRNNGSWLVSATAGTVPTGAWSHIVYTNNTSTGNKIYVNGVVTSPSYSQGSASSDVFTDNISFNTSTIGASKDSSNGYEWGMIGNLQQLLIYDKTLSQADVTALYNGGKYGTPSTTNLLRKYELTSDANDTSGNGHNGTVAGSLTYTSLAIPQGTGTWTNPKIKTALTIDTVNYESTQSTASSRSLSFTVNAETDQHKMLIVGISGGGAALTVTGVTYAGVSMTALATGGSGSPYYSEYRLFYLLDPPTGTANITATQSTGTNMSIRFGLSVYGAKQSAPVAVGSGRYATPNTLTQSITASVSGSWIISSITGGEVNNASTPSNYYSLAELATLNLGTASYKQNGLDQSPTIGSVSSPSFNYKHPANNNAQPVGMFSLVLEPYG